MCRTTHILFSVQQTWGNKSLSCLLALADRGSHKYIALLPFALCRPQQVPSGTHQERVKFLSIRREDVQKKRNELRKHRKQGVWC